MRLRYGPRRLLTFCASVLVLAIAGLVPLPGALAQEATPTAIGTPVAAPTAAPTEAPQTASTDVVTLVAWYANDPSGDFLNILPLQVGGDNVASANPAGASIGQAQLPNPDTGLPRITIGDASFDGYLRYEGDVPERWTWFDDTEGARPATLVIQVSGVGGPYQDYFGTATFVSRDDLAGGTLILALRPPVPAAVEEAAAEEAVAEEAVAAEAPADAVPTEAPPVEGEVTQ